MVLYLSLIISVLSCKILNIKRPLIIAHRGYCSIIPENSLEALIAAAY